VSVGAWLSILGLLLLPVIFWGEFFLEALDDLRRRPAPASPPCGYSGSPEVAGL
jgi:hypothetical protein